MENTHQSIIFVSRIIKSRKKAWQITIVHITYEVPKSVVDFRNWYSVPRNLSLDNFSSQKKFFLEVLNLKS